MKTLTMLSAVLLAAALITPPLSVRAQGTSPSVTASPIGSATAGANQAPNGAQPNDPEMMKQMMELAKPGENHKLLDSLAGTWTYGVKMWMAPGAPPMESKGTAVRKPMMDGRYFTMDVSGKMQMPGPDGKMKDFDFKGMSIEGYDNVQKKFVSTWIDNMGTGIIMSEGTYDPATKTFSYNAEMEMIPGVKTKVREVVKIIDANHHNFEWYEDRGGKEAKTMEISYTRKK